MASSTRYAARRPARRGNPWTLPAVAAAVAVIVVVAIIRGLGTGGGAAAANAPVPADVLQQLTQIPAATWDAAGTQGAIMPTFVGGAAAATGSASATAAAGKPTVLYIGAEYCPFCAAERWSMVTALARFGTFQGLEYSHSASNDNYPNTPTFTFYGSTYASPYIDFQPVETLTNVPGGPNGYTNLQTPTAAQQALLQKYNAAPYFSTQQAGHIPFLLVGEKYAWVGSAFSPQTLDGSTQAKIAAGLAAGTSPVAQAILANANMIAASICAVDGAQPASVCGSGAVAPVIKALPTTGTGG